MPYFVLENAAKIHAAIGAMSTVHGAYSAINLLTKAFEQVDEPEEFQADVRRLEAKEGLAYQGPDGAGHEVAKAVKTAAESNPPEQDAILQLVTLVMTKLGVSQGSRVLGLLLAVAGYDPTLLIVVLRLCILLAQTETGRRIVAAAAPKLKDALVAATDRASLAQPLQQLTASLGERGYELAAALAEMPLDTAKAALHSGRNVVDMLSDRLPVQAKLADPPAG